MSQRVKRNLARFALRCATLRRGPVVARLGKTCLNQNLSELIRQARCALVLRSIRKDVRVRVVARWQRAQIIDERLDERQHDAPACLFRSELDLVRLKVDGAPGEPRKITETLTEIQAEEHKTAPLSVARFDDALDLCERERSAL